MNWQAWLHGLGAAVIAGAASVAVGFAAGADWRVTAKMSALSAVVNAAAYLKQSPLPAGKMSAPVSTSKE